MIWPFSGSYWSGIFMASEGFGRFISKLAWQVLR
tara:strand:+ start:410 stop:511 length:102 start_codon:yes stop_codon:yes gene_type:complete